MFPLFRHIGHTARFAPPPRSTALREHLAADVTALERLLAAAWRHVRSFWNILKLIRFSVLLAAVCVAVILLNDQAQDALRALGEEPGLPTVLFVVAAVVCAAVAWWDSRVMFYFRFQNPASDPDEMPTVKEFLPRILGGLALLVTGIAAIRASYAYEDWSDPVRWLWGIGIVLILLAAIFVYATIMRRNWFNGKKPRSRRCDASWVRKHRMKVRSRTAIGACAPRCSRCSRANDQIHAASATASRAPQSRSRCGSQPARMSTPRSGILLGPQHEAVVGIALLPSSVQGPIVGLWR